MAQVVGYF